MSSNVRNFLYFVICAVFAIALTVYFLDKQFWINQTQSSQVAQNTTAITEETPSAKLVSKVKYAHRHVARFDQYRCTDNSIGEIQYKQTHGLYTWVDERGVTHISDQKPKQHRALKYQVANQQALDYFALNLQTLGLPAAFKNELESKLNAVFKIYAHLLGIGSLKKIELNLKVLANKQQYLQELAKLGWTGGQSVGVYSYAANSAVIQYTDYQQTMQTAIHEAVHAINAGLFGITNDWMNEGLAEYFEKIETQLQQRIVKTNGSWLNKMHQVAHQFIPLEDLLTANIGLVADNKKHALYANSWASMYFLMSSTQGRVLLKALMKAEQESPCIKLNKKQIQQLAK
ncbi:DUF1570 domain-containing protein [Catenovulum sediminis]|uniref:DUF1570 domain-containing protein n=1 Tax=Catenovulum sediminis TaxID=1740262 RepID=UPI00118159AD|nr:DUF1570 domain-containing protein [Catenovulum sediminis]